MTDRKAYTPGEWLDDSDTDADDDRPTAPAAPRDDADSGAVAGCVFGLAMIVLCLTLVWMLAQTGGAW